MKENIFDRVEKKTKVKKEDILKLAKKISGQDLSDEDNLRTLIKDVAKLAGKELSKEKEEKIISAVKKDKIPNKMDDLIYHIYKFFLISFRGIWGGIWTF